jgi:hypothetical protein
LVITRLHAGSVRWLAMCAALVSPWSECARSADAVSMFPQRTAKYRNKEQFEYDNPQRYQARRSGTGRACCA